MVKSHKKRILKYAAKTDARVAMLYAKNALRNSNVVPAASMTVNALKDAIGKTMIDTYNLNLRDNLNAWQAWRELYYMYFPTIQAMAMVS